MAWWKFWEKDPKPVESGVTPAFDPNRAGDFSRVDDDPEFFWNSSSGLSGRTKGDAIPAAYAAIAILTAQMAMLQPVVVRNELPTTNRLNMLLRFPNRTIDPHQFWMMFYRPYFARGNSYTYIRRDFQRQAIELVPATCIDSEFRESRHAPYVRYRLELLGADLRGGLTAKRQVVTTSRDVIALHGIGFDGLQSPSPIQYAALNAIETMRRISRHEREVIKDGSNTGTVMTMDADAINLSNPKAWENIIKMIKTGMDKAKHEKKIPMLPPGVKLEKFDSISNVDLQLVELLRWGVEDIARVWRISPVRLGHFHEGMRVAGMEAQFTDFALFTLAEHVHAAAEQLTRKLLSAAQIVDNHEIMIPTDSLKRGSLSERSKVAKEMVSDGGVWTINEGRELTGKPPREDGDRLLQPKGAPAQNTGGDDE